MNELATKTRVELTDHEWDRIERAHRTLAAHPNDSGSPLCDVIEDIIADRNVAAALARQAQGRTYECCEHCVDGSTFHEENPANGHKTACEQCARGLADGRASL